MKKILALILCAAMLFCVTACNEISENNSSIIETDTSSQGTQETSVIESTIDVSNQTVTSDIKTEESSEPLENNTSTQNTESSSEIAENSEPTESSNPDKESKPTEESKPVESSEPEHIHKFSKTTCTEPQKCECGETKGKALGHRFTKATCTTPLTCLVCNATEGEALGHDWIDATCNTPKKCSLCKKTDGDKLSHQYNGGICELCKADSSNYKRVFSRDNTFSVLVSKEIYNSETIATGMYHTDSIEFICPYVEFEYINTRAIVFEAVKNSDASEYEKTWYEPFGDYFGATSNEKMGFKLEKVASNEEYTIYCQYIYIREYATGTKEDLVRFNALLDLKDELCKSINFN